MCSGWNPQNPNFGGVNRRFQAKRAKYWKFHVIETTASILTKFGTTTETTKWSSTVVPVGAKQIQDGGRLPFWKKTVTSPYLCDRSTDFDEIWHDDAYTPLTSKWPLKCRISENPRWRRLPSWKSQNRDISATVWPIFAKFGMMMQNGCHKRPDRLKFVFQKSKMADGRHFENICNRLRDFDEIWYGDACWLLTAERPLKFRISENPRWRQPPSWKSQKSRYLRDGLTDLYEIWYDR